MRAEMALNGLDMEWKRIEMETNSLELIWKRYASNGIDLRRNGMETNGPDAEANG